MRRTLLRWTWNTLAFWGLVKVGFSVYEVLFPDEYAKLREKFGLPAYADADTKKGSKRK